MLSVLIADDEYIEREGIRFLLEESPYEFRIHMAQNGEEALRCLEEQDIDILFTDIKMPFMDGLELLTEANRKYSALKIVIFSAFADFNYARTALENRVMYYFLKPVDPDEFQKVLDRVVQSVQEEKERTKKSREPDGNDEAGDLWENGTAPQSSVIRFVMEIVEKRYQEDLSLVSIAEEVYLTPSYLSYLFKKEAGVSLIKYITMIRLEKAKELLRTGNMRIADIADRVGFQNYSHFNVTFKNNVGMSPAQYRERER